MKVMNRIKGFFSALVPVFVYLAVQFTIGLLATLTVLAVEMTRNPAIPETAPYRSSLLIVLVSTERSSVPKYTSCLQTSGTQQAPNALTSTSRRSIL